MKKLAYLIAINSMLTMLPFANATVLVQKGTSARNTASGQSIRSGVPMTGNGSVYPVTVKNVKIDLERNQVTVMVQESGPDKSPIFLIFSGDDRGFGASLMGAIGKRGEFEHVADKLVEMSVY